MVTAKLLVADGAFDQLSPGETPVLSQVYNFGYTPLCSKPKPLNDIRPVTTGDGSCSELFLHAGCNTTRKSNLMIIFFDVIVYSFMLVALT